VATQTQLHHPGHLRTLERIAPPHQLHHSTPDWQKSTPNWQLTDIFGVISPPYALTGTVGTSIFLSNLPAAQNLPDGMFITWFRHRSAIPCRIFFRWQTQALIQLTDPHYEVRFQRDGFYSLWCQHEAGLYQVGTWPYHTSSTAYWRIRITWWRGSTPQGVWALCTQMDLWIAGGWLSFGILYDTADRWHDSPINRTGLYLESTSNIYDDTEIWKPV